VPKLPIGAGSSLDLRCWLGHQALERLQVIPSGLKVFEVT
jgi:hypothetical protein